MNLDIPQRWAFDTEDRTLFQKYYHATLLQQFGDIPQVRYIVEFARMGRSGIVTLEFAKQIAANSEAMYFLFPTADSRRSLEEARNLLKLIETTCAKLKDLVRAYKKNFVCWISSE